MTTGKQNIQSTRLLGSSAWIGALSALLVAATFLLSMPAAAQLVTGGAAPTADPLDAPVIQEGWDADVRHPPSLDTWSGTAITADARSSFGGAIYAWSGDKTRDGLRIRIEGGTSTYVYETTRTTGVELRQGKAIFASVMLGYQWSHDAWTVKGFLGPAYASHEITPVDLDNDLVGERWGARLSVDVWRNMPYDGFFSLNADLASPFASYAAGARYGVKVIDDLWLGLAAGLYGNRELDAARVGGFLRWRTPYGTLWAEGGVGGDYADLNAPYATVTLAREF
ncbi:MAG: cellulose biosynthesis protein BcsS [Pseudomonadota bacterium]